MDPTYQSLATKIRHLATSNHPARTIIGIAGPPGSGKSTIAHHVAALLNQTHPPPPASPDTPSPPRAVVVPMDGFHLTRAQLDKLPDPVLAHARRGAPWTFDAQAVLAFVRALRTEPRGVIWGPSFDHEGKDPVVDDIRIPAEASVVILEGNYLLLAEEPWWDIAALLDYRVLVRVGREEARRRVARRHVSVGIEATVDAAEARFDGNDGLNGELVLAKVMPFDVVVESVDVLSWTVAWWRWSRLLKSWLVRQLL